MDAKFEDESDFKPRHACPERDEICRHRGVRREGSAHLGVTGEAIIQMSLAPQILRYRMGCSGRAEGCSQWEAAIAAGEHTNYKKRLTMMMNVFP